MQTLIYLAVEARIWFSWIQWVIANYSKKGQKLHWRTEYNTKCDREWETRHGFRAVDTTNKNESRTKFGVKFRFQIENMYDFLCNK